MVSQRILAGRNSGKHGNIANLAIAVAAAAQKHGFRVVAVKSSSVKISASKYIELCAWDRTWLIRVSDHHRPSRTWHEQPHLDLVSLDGQSGIGQADLWLAKAAIGQVPWTDPASSEHPPAMKRRNKKKLRRINRSQRK